MSAQNDFLRNAAEGGFKTAVDLDIDLDDLDENALVTLDSSDVESALAALAELQLNRWDVSSAATDGYICSAYLAAARSISSPERLQYSFSDQAGPLTTSISGISGDLCAMVVAAKSIPVLADADAINESIRRVTDVGCDAVIAALASASPWMEWGNLDLRCALALILLEKSQLLHDGRYLLPETKLDSTLLLLDGSLPAVQALHPFEFEEAVRTLVRVLVRSDARAAFSEKPRNLIRKLLVRWRSQWSLGGLNVMEELFRRVPRLEGAQHEVVARICLFYLTIRRQGGATLLL